MIVLGCVQKSGSDRFVFPKALYHLVPVAVKLADERPQGPDEPAQAEQACSPHENRDDPPGAGGRRSYTSHNNNQNDRDEREARNIADQRARKELGDPLIKYRATGIVRLIHTWYCVLLVPGDDA